MSIKRRREENIEEEIHFHADIVEGYEEPDSLIHGIYFEYGPEESGQSWNFMRDLSNDDGVCIVKKEGQSGTCYGGISSFVLSREGLLCEFDENAAREMGVRRLRITFSVDEDAWTQLTQQAHLIFQEEPYATKFLSL